MEVLAECVLENKVLITHEDIINHIINFKLQVMVIQQRNLVSTLG